MELKPPVKEFYVTFYTNNKSSEKKDFLVRSIWTSYIAESINKLNDVYHTQVIFDCLQKQDEEEPLTAGSSQARFCSIKRLREISLDCKTIPPEPHIFKPGFLPDVIDKYVLFIFHILTE